MAQLNQKTKLIRDLSLDAKRPLEPILTIKEDQRSFENGARSKSADQGGGRNSSSKEGELTVPFQLPLQLPFRASVVVVAGCRQVALSAQEEKFEDSKDF